MCPFLRQPEKWLTSSSRIVEAFTGEKYNWWEHSYTEHGQPGFTTLTLAYQTREGGAQKCP